MLKIRRKKEWFLTPKSNRENRKAGVEGKEDWMENRMERRNRKKKTGRRRRRRERKIYRGQEGGGRKITKQTQ